MRRPTLLGAVALTLLTADARSQIGGDGRDGALTPTSDVLLDTSQGGRFQFTMIRIPRGVTVRVRGPNRALLQVRGTVVIDGTLDGDGAPPVGSTAGAGGPGGFAGGRGGRWTLGANTATDGLGPGGGWRAFTGGCPAYGTPAAHATAGTGGTFPNTRTYGTAIPFDLRGGSGGGGGTRVSLCGGSPTGPGGSGGGGVIAILADGAVQITGRLSARGGAGSTPGSGGALFVRSVTSVRVSGQIDAAGGSFQQLRGGDGFIRLEAWSAPPALGGATVTPVPTALELPQIRATSAPKIGQPWTFTALAMPQDRLFFFISIRGVARPAPPYGTLRLDPLPGIFFLGTADVAPAGHDPMGWFALPVPNDQRLVGQVFHVQAFDWITATGRPRLTNSIVGRVAR